MISRYIDKEERNRIRYLEGFRAIFGLCVFLFWGLHSEFNGSDVWIIAIVSLLFFIVYIKLNRLNERKVKSKKERNDLYFLKKISEEIKWKENT